MDNQILNKVVSDAINNVNITKYLDVVKNNPHLSTLNQAMVYLQKPGAKKICGRGAWEDEGGKVKSDAVPIILYFPNIALKNMPKEFEEDDIVQETGGVKIYETEPEFSSDYIPVNAFDIGSVEGIEEKEEAKPMFAQQIIQCSATTLEFVPKSSIDGYEGRFDPETNTYLISNEISPHTEYGLNAYNKILLELYVESVLDSYGEDDKMLLLAVKYAVLGHFEFKTDIESVLFSRLNDRSTEEKIHFITMVQFYVNGIIQDMKGYILNFDETAIINSVLNTDDPEEMYIELGKVVESVENQLLKDEVVRLREKLMRLKEGTLTDIYVRKTTQKLFTYPPTVLIIDPTDYLREDRLSELKKELLTVIFPVNKKKRGLF